jgi:hypothetical protein
MKSQRQQKQLEQEGKRNLDFGDHSKEAERARVESENPGHRTAHRRSSELGPGARRREDETPAAEE